MPFPPNGYIKCDRCGLGKKGVKEVEYTPDPSCPLLKMCIKCRNKYSNWVVIHEKAKAEK